MFKTHLRRRDQTGGAISLWVVLMTPVAAFAAVVAMAGPQRLAAESSIDETAADLAAFSVVLRDGREGQQTGALDGFLPDCEQLALIGPDGTDPVRWDIQRNQLQEACWLLLGNPDDPAGTAGAYWLRDLGYLGIDANSWEGFYSDAVTASDGCVISGNLETRNAVYAALAADWQDAGWAAAQVWPEGVRMGSEQVARLHQSVPPTPDLVRCDAQFDTPPNPDLARTVFTN